MACLSKYLDAAFETPVGGAEELDRALLWPIEGPEPMLVAGKILLAVNSIWSTFC